jgi:predicted extracellular nuclease
VLNHLLTLDDGVNDICGPARGQECRGADDAQEFERQRAKILAALADIVGGLNAQLGAGTYDYIDTGTIGTDAIEVGIIYRPSRRSVTSRSSTRGGSSTRSTGLSSHGRSRT